MGVNLRDLFPQHAVPESWYAGRRIAVDAPNVAFRYLTSVRGPDGGPLRNADGRVTAHLLGFTNLVRHLRERGAEPVFVWDGGVHPRKKATVDERIQRRLEAALQAEEALVQGDRAAHLKFVRATTVLDRAMVEDASRLLSSLGVAWVRADHDAERYAAGLCAAGHADAVATEDYDALVAGAPSVLRKAGSAAAFAHHLGDVALTPRQLRQVAILCGTDWNPGVKGFGAKTALKALAEHPDLAELVAAAHAGVPGRWHDLVRASGLTVEEFRDLEAFIAEVPAPPQPQAPMPDPKAAVELADAWGLGRSRVVACFT